MLPTQQCLDTDDVTFGQAFLRSINLLPNEARSELIRDARDDEWPAIYPFFSRIVAEGRDGVYRGPVAEAIDEASATTSSSSTATARSARTRPSSAGRRCWTAAR